MRTAYCGDRAQLPEADQPITAGTTAAGVAAGALRTREAGLGRWAAGG
jgi:hypothetical protein